MADREPSLCLFRALRASFLHDADVLRPRGGENASLESTVEEAALVRLEGVGWQIALGPEIAPATLAAERAGCGDVVFSQRLRDAFVLLNPDLPADALEDTFCELTRVEGADLVARNRGMQGNGAHGGAEGAETSARCCAIVARSSGSRVRQTVPEGV